LDFENSNEVSTMLALVGIIPPTDCWSVYVNVK
jgi:hypothetical protein